MGIHLLAADVARHFQLGGELVGVAPYGNGHINDTYEIRCDQKGAAVRYILQRLNPAVFRDPVGLMENVARVTAHIRGKLQEAAVKDVSRRVLTLVPARDSRYHLLDEEGSCWRVYQFVEDTVTFDIVTSPQQAAEVAAAYGRFHQLLLDLPGLPLTETIRDFHSAGRRLEALLGAIEADVCNRAATARSEIDFALCRKEIVDALAVALDDGDVPERITHNDTKINNVLFDARTAAALCVIDLDTVMPGRTLFDFGDMVRTVVGTAREDESEPSRMTLNRANFEALAKGYWESAKSFLTAGEKRHLVFGGKLVTFVSGMRFLTDYLVGDTYFKIHRRGHNLARCRTQFKLVECIEAQEEELTRFVDQLK